jgi:hypothetical protein
MTDKKFMTKKLKTNGEVIAAIKRGFPKTAKYDQLRFTSDDKSETHPCGTAYCMFGAIAANYGGIHGSANLMMNMVIEKRGSLFHNWSAVFGATRAEGAFREMKKFLTEKQYTEITTFLMERKK